MKKRIFIQNKLWKHKTITDFRAEGSIINTVKLSDAEYSSALRAKLVEEAKEVQAAQSPKELISEIADVLEVIEALQVCHNLDLEKILAKKAQTRAVRGDLGPETFVTTVEHPVGSHGEQYCLAQPEKYPEVTE